MRFEDQPASGSQPSPAEPGARPRRRAPRSWSVPAGRERFDKPIWPTTTGPGRPTPPRRPARPSARPRRTAEPPGPPRRPPAPTSVPLTSLLRDLRGELGQLRAALEASAPPRTTPSSPAPSWRPASRPSAATLGSGIASLLTEHRNLLARDIEGAAVRILEEVSQRLRVSGNQVVDGVEERVRHVNAKSLGDVVEQLDLRLDQIQADVTGLRAVMLEIPDQTAVVERLDQLAESRRPRVAGPGDDPSHPRHERRHRAGRRRPPRAARGAARRAAARWPRRDVRGGRRRPPDAAALEALTTEMLQLRRRITLRTDARGEAVELSDRQLDDLADRIVARMAGQDRDLDDEPDPEVPVPRRARKSAARPPSRRSAPKR